MALVTGGTRGIGQAISERFLRAGAKVVIVSRSEVALETLGFASSTGLYHQVYDVTQPAAAAQLVDDVRAQHGGIDILVNNAGTHLKKAAVDTSAEDMEAMLRTHITGAHALAAAAYPSMRKRGGGSILFIASMASRMGLPEVSAYSAAKTGVLGLVRSLAAEWSAHGIRVNAIAPGWIETEMLRKVLDVDPARADRILQRTPMRRFGDPGDVAAAAHFLCSEEAGFITGAVLPVDGGASIGF